MRGALQLDEVAKCAERAVCFLGQDTFLTQFPAVSVWKIGAGLMGHKVRMQTFNNCFYKVSHPLVATSIHNTVDCDTDFGEMFTDMLGVQENLRINLCIDSRIVTCSSLT